MSIASAPMKIGATWYDRIRRTWFVFTLDGPVPCAASTDTVALSPPPRARSNPAPFRIE